MADGTQAKASLRRRARRAHERATRELVATARREANKDTGAMARSVAVTPTTGTDRLTGRIYVPDTGSPRQSDKARWTSSGTRPHVIRAKRAKALRWQQGGKVRFAKAVNHPGYRGSQWWPRSVRRWPQAIRSSWRSS